MKVYYNEIDPFAAQWLRELIKAGHIAPGDVDERSIEDITPNEIKDYTQCHFFAGIGVWSYALRQAGWPDDRPVWTGSCPCQPFSAAGKGTGFTDERHLWPAWFHLIEQCRPAQIFGEQVASKDGLAWLDLVQTDLEGASYAGGAIDLCAAGFGAPHIRQRLWLAYSESNRQQRESLRSERGLSKNGVAENSLAGGLADSGLSGYKDAKTRGSVSEKTGERQQSTNQVAGYSIVSTKHKDGRNIIAASKIGWLADTNSAGSQSRGEAAETTRHRNSVITEGGADQYRHPDPTNGFWGAADWLRCRDDKWRPVEPGTSPLVDGTPARVGRLRCYGNAINAEVAKAFIEIIK